MVCSLLPDATSITVPSGPPRVTLRRAGRATAHTTRRCQNLVMARRIHPACIASIAGAYFSASSFVNDHPEAHEQDDATEGAQDRSEERRPRTVRPWEPAPPERHDRSLQKD